MTITKEKVLIGEMSRILARSGIKVKLADEEIALFKTSSGEVFAIENKSPHPKGGVLSEGLVSGEYVFCPVYDWKISLRDGTVQAPDIGQVKTFKTQVEDGKVYIVL